MLDITDRPRVDPTPRSLVKSSDLAELTTKQKLANKLVGGKQTHTCLVGGSRSGKTTLFTRLVVLRAQKAPNSRHLMARFRANAAKASLYADTFKKVMRTWYPTATWSKRSEGYLELENGSQIWITGLDESDRVEKILGMEFATIYANECSQIPYSSILMLRTRLAQPSTGLRLKGFYDLNPTTKAHWTNIEFGEKRDPMTNTLLEDPENYERMFINPVDNEDNLDPAYIKSLSRMPKAYRERFFEGKYVDAIEGALWTVDLLELCREDEILPDAKGRRLHEFERIVVGVDPSGAQQTKAERKSSEIGIVCAGKRKSNSAVVLEDATMHGGPKEWGRRVVATYKKWKADLVVAEANYGGAMVESTIRAVDPNVPVKLVNASRGKVLRAEPVAALYEHDEHELPKVTHAGHFDLLEDQLCLFAREGYKGEKSPDRADAMVWAVTELMLNDDKYNGYTLAYVR